MIIGYTTGVFDMFHIGHLNLLKRAKSKCDYLIVGVSTDELVLTEKNKKPIISFHERFQIISSIKYADLVVKQKNKNKMAAWERHKFHKMFVGSDWKGTETWNKFEEEFNQINVEIIYLEYTTGVSSTKLTQLLKSLSQ